MTVETVIATAPMWAPLVVAGYAFLSRRWVFLRRIKPLIDLLAKAAVAEVEADYVAPSKVKWGNDKLPLFSQHDAASKAFDKVRASARNLGADVDEEEAMAAIERAVKALKPKDRIQ